MDHTWISFVDFTEDTVDIKDRDLIETEIIDGKRKKTGHVNDIYPDTLSAMYDEKIESLSTGLMFRRYASTIPFGYACSMGMVFLRYMSHTYKLRETNIAVPQNFHFLVRFRNDIIEQFYAKKNYQGLVKIPRDENTQTNHNEVCMRIIHNLIELVFSRLWHIASDHHDKKITTALNDMLKYTGETEHELRKDPTNKKLCEKYEMATLRISYALALLDIKHCFVIGEDAWPVTYRRIMLLLFSGLDGSFFEEKTDPGALSVAEFLEQMLSDS